MMRLTIFAACLAAVGCVASPDAWNIHAGNGQGLLFGTTTDDTLPPHYPTCGRYSRCVDGHAVGAAANRSAKRHLEALEGNGCCRFSDDFEDGYRQAWQDVARGLSGKTPAVPPQKYWKAENRTPGGHARARDWFAGYETGATEARCAPLGNYRNVPSSLIR